MYKIAIINRGIPASGKSTFAKEIKQKLSQKYGLETIICSTDDFFYKNGKYIFDRDKLREYHLKNQERFQKALDKKVDVVICDNTNIEPWEAEPYYYMAKVNNYKVILIDFEPRELKSHIKAQSNSGYEHNIPQDILENMWKRYIDFKELTDKYSYPKEIHKKKIFNELLNKTEQTDELSEPFFYDKLIKISVKEQKEIFKIIPDLVYQNMRDFSLDEISLIDEELKAIMEEFMLRADKTLTAYDLKDKLGKSVKQIERYIEDKLMVEFGNIIPTKKGRKKAYKLIDTYDVFIEAFKNRDDLDYLLELARETSPELFKKLEHRFSNEDSIFLFKNHIFENIENKGIFNNLKDAIKNREYKNLVFKYEEEVKDVKCIKLVFIDNNWYIAYVDDKNILKLGRVHFIKNIKPSYKNTFQESTVLEHKRFLKDKLQNSMTLYDKDFQTATIKAMPTIAKYFEADMKRFFPTQYFIKKEDDGSVIFQVKYTQPMEILPFIQRWLPDLVIQEPQSLKDEYIKKLNTAIKNNSLSN